MFGLLEKNTLLLVIVAMMLLGAVASVDAAPLLQRSTTTEQGDNSMVQGESEGQAGTSLNYELLQRVQAMQEELQRLRGMIEEQNYTIEQMKSSERDRYADIDQRLNALKSQNPAPLASVDASESVQNPALDDETKTYQSAKSKLDNKEYNSAIAEFSLYLEYFPEGKYVPQAHYWMGELYMALPVPELDNAQKEFEAVIKQFPKHPKTPDSLYKLGILQIQKNDKTAAKQSFERILSEFPESASASLAKNQLKSL